MVYDLVAAQAAHPPPTPVDERLLQMTLQYLQETGQVVDDASVADLQPQDAVMEEWAYDYYMLHSDDDDDMGDESVYDGLTKKQHGFTQA